MESKLDEYSGKYTIKWVEDNLDIRKTIMAGKRQWSIAGLIMGSVETNKTVEKYARAKILEALNCENNFGALLDLKEKWAKGKVKQTMLAEIKAGTYLQKTEWIYKTGKHFCCFVDKNDPTHRLNIDANQALVIKEMREYGNPCSMIIKAMKLDVTESELEEYITENMEGNLDSAFLFIARKSKENGLVNYKNTSEELLQNKSVYDFKITIGE